MTDAAPPRATARTRIGSARVWIAALVVASCAAVNPYVRGDGNGYYAWLVSTVIDHDLDFRNQFSRGDQLFREQYFDQQGQVRPSMTSATGHLVNQWSVGPALLWAPWFLAAHAAVALANVAGAAIPADGYAWPYRWACAIGTVCYGWLAVWLAAACARQLGASTASARLASAAVWAATALPVYQYFLPFSAHAMAAFTVSLFIWYWLAHRSMARVAQWGVWGLIAGLMTIVYHLNAVALVLVGWAIYESTIEARLRARVAAAAAFAGAFLAAWVPQLTGKAIVYGSPFVSGYQEDFLWLSPRLWATAFSSERGLFLWSPITLAGVAGLVWIARRRRDAAIMTLMFVAMFLLVAAHDLHAVSSFGNRFFVSLTVLFVIGVAALLDAVARSRVARASAIAAMVLLALWNAGLAFQWGTKLLPNRGPVDVRLAVTRQFTVVPGAFGHAVREYLTDRPAFVARIERADAREWHASREDR